MSYNLLLLIVISTLTAFIMYTKSTSFNKELDYSSIIYMVCIVSQFCWYSNTV